MNNQHKVGLLLERHFKKGDPADARVDIVSPVNPDRAEIDGSCRGCGDGPGDRSLAPSIVAEDDVSSCFQINRRNVELLVQLFKIVTQPLCLKRHLQVPGEWLQLIDAAGKRLLRLIQQVNKAHLAPVPDVKLEQRDELLDRTQEGLEPFSHRRGKDIPALEIVWAFAGQISLENLFWFDTISHKRGTGRPGAHPQEQIKIIDGEPVVEQIIQRRQRPDLEQIAGNASTRECQRQSTRLPHTMPHPRFPPVSHLARTLAILKAWLPLFQKCRGAFLLIF